MNPAYKATVEDRAISAAESALFHQKYVSPIDVLTRMGLLQPIHVEQWRKGRIDFLEREIQANPKKVWLALSTFRKWAEAQGLNPAETKYVRTGRMGAADLQFTASGDPSMEAIYRTHYLSPELTEKNQQKLQQKLEKPKGLVVFQVLRPSTCAECSTDIEKNGMLLMDGEHPYCLPCVGLADLEFLPSGDMALTRRSTKYSGRVAVVVCFSRSRGRYERQGIMADPAAIERAEAECTDDAEERKNNRERGALQREEEDKVLVKRMTQQILGLYPKCPPAEARQVAAHTAKRGSGRVGRTAAGRNLEESPLTAAVKAAVRHRHTNYDELLLNGVDRADARERVAGQIAEIFNQWGG